METFNRSVTSRPAPYDQRNIEDYKLIGKNISLALDKIQGDDCIPATEESLASLAGCSRGTLRNRKWPLVRLREIKKQRKTRSGKAQQKTATKQPQNKEEELVMALNASRNEAARWFDKYKDSEADNRKFRRANNLLKEEKEALIRELTQLRNQKTTSSPMISDMSKPSGSVTQFPDRSAAGA